MSDRIQWGRVAELYDTYVQTTFDVPFFLGETDKVPGEILELMAGTGRLTLPLLEAGANLTCIDNSPEMLAVLRQKVAARDFSTTIHQMDARELSLNKLFDLILLPFHSFSEVIIPAERRRLLTGVYNHLSAAGHFICTLHNPLVRLKPVDGQLRLWGRHTFEDSQRQLLVWGAEQYDTQQHVVNGLQFFEEYDGAGEMQTKTKLDIRFAVIEKEEFETMAAAAGFKIVAFYGNYTYAPFQNETSPYMIWKLRK